jgi:glycosyltransferase involved in cell wall biosynthesis
MNHNPISVLHLITELNTGGAEQMLFKVICRMDRERFRSIVVTMTERGSIGEKIAAEGFQVHELGMSLGRPRLSGAWKLHRLIRRERVHILQTWLYHADLLGLLVGKISPVQRIVWGIRCSEMDLRNYRTLTAITLRICSLLSSRVDAIVVNSEEGKRVHSRIGYPPSKMVIIPNGFDTDLFKPDPEARRRLREELGLGTNALLIGLVARFDPMKDHDSFFKAAALLSSQEDVHFVLAGKGMVPENKDIASRLKTAFEGRVHLLGLREDIPGITAGLDIATSCSAYGEGFSNTIGEAMACGVPCVVTNVGDSAKIIGDTGLVIPPRDPVALAEAWGSLLKAGRIRREELGRQARERAIEEYGIGRVVNRFERFYEGLVRDPGFRPPYAGCWN